NLDIEREPGLDPAADETKARVEIVLIQVQALARLQAQPSLGRIRCAVVLEGHARLEHTEHTNQPALERMLLKQAARQGFLVKLGVGDVRNRAVLIERFLHRARMSCSVVLTEYCLKSIRRTPARARKVCMPRSHTSGSSVPRNTKRSKPRNTA